MAIVLWVTLAIFAEKFYKNFLIDGFSYLRISIFFIKANTSVRWVDAIELLAQYFRVEVEDSKDQNLELVVDQCLDLKFSCVTNDYLLFRGYFAQKLTEDSFLRIKSMLQWNFARIADTNDTLSIDSESKRLCLFRKKSLTSLFVDNIFSEVESFVSNLEFWSDAFEYTREAPRGSNLMIFGF
ncbi:MAG: hypothetical protein LBJ13_02250 [Puniceicoccales bacterium]|jgi:hypothetical protein|nr:hypothetical protein [Puniceicoccales bacterium]